MSTIKFIIEIDEQYVRDCADPTKSAENAIGGGKIDFLKGLFNFIGFSFVKKGIDAGTTEFVINRDNIDGRANEIFDHALSDLAILVGITKKAKEEDEGEEKAEE